MERVLENDDLSQLEEIELAKSDRAYLEIFFEKNRNLIWTGIYRCFGSTYNLGIFRRRMAVDDADLFNIGAIGFLKAVDKFDPSFGAQFSTYAIPMIIGEIKRFGRDNSEAGIGLSRTVKETLSRLKKIEFVNNGLPVDIREQLISLLGNGSDDIKEKTVDDALRYYTTGSFVYLDSQLEDEDSHNPSFMTGKIGTEDIDSEHINMSYNPSEEGSYSILLRQVYESIAPYLTEVERGVYREKIQKDQVLGQVELGKTLGCSQVQISRAIVTIQEFLRLYSAISIVLYDYRSLGLYDYTDQVSLMSNWAQRHNRVPTMSKTRSLLEKAGLTTLKKRAYNYVAESIATYYGFNKRVESTEKTMDVELEAVISEEGILIEMKETKSNSSEITEITEGRIYLVRKKISIKKLSNVLIEAISSAYSDGWTKADVSVDIRRVK